jgi:hypothetical protein
MFVPAHPLHAHGLPDELGHQGGIGGRGIGTIVAVTACALGVYHPDRGLRKAEDVRKGLLQRVYALRARPDRRLDPIGIGRGGDVRDGA